MDDDVQRLNDQLRQREHAEAIKARTAERRQTPEDRETAKLIAQFGPIIVREVENALKSFKIQNGQGITISGQGRNITIGAQNPAQGGNGQQGGNSEGIWLEAVEFCDGTVADLWARNVIPPP